MTVSDNGTPMCFGGDCGFGSGGFIWAFLIFALLMGNGGFGFGNNGLANAIGYENLATSAEVQRGFDNQNLQSQTRDILSAVTNGTAQTVAATNEVYHNIAQNLGDKYTELARDVAGVNANVSQAIANQCMLNGELKLQLAEGFGQNRFDSAMSTATINAVTTAQTQKILDALAQNKIETLQGKVNQLELDRAMAGVVRYPNAMTYGAGPSPFCNCGSVGYPIYN